MLKKRCFKFSPEMEKKILIRTKEKLDEHFRKRFGSLSSVSLIFIDSVSDFIRFYNEAAEEIQKEEKI